MTVFWALIAVTLVVAVADWWAVATARRPVEYVFKPLTMVVLIGAVLALGDPASEAARWWLAAGLVCSLAGDVFLMLDDLFVPGLASFLVGHLCYIAALVNLGLDRNALLVGVAVVLVASLLVGRIVVLGARRTDRRLTVPVAAYITAISVTVACAIGTTIPVAIAGALLFYLSDACIGWSRFVGDFPQSRMAIITTYHLGQIGLVLGLAAAA
ncbi:MAG: hypothetical protein KGR17_00875 [Acidobacteria bacterium]|nr:hypothetical protein [Acidobacteriota bacterium]